MTPFDAVGKRNPKSLTHNPEEITVVMDSYPVARSQPPAMTLGSPRCVYHPNSTKSETRHHWLLVVRRAERGVDKSRNDLREVFLVRGSTGGRIATEAKAWRTQRCRAMKSLLL